MSFKPPRSLNLREIDGEKWDRLRDKAPRTACNAEIFNAIMDHALDDPQFRVKRKYEA